MIIKINVNDNDFAGEICDILQRKVNGLWLICNDYYDKLLDDLDDSDKKDEEFYKKYRALTDERDEVRNFLAYGDEETDKKYNKRKILNIIKECVLFMVKNSFSEDDLDYLRGSIEISNPKTMRAEWANGEEIYYIPNTYSENKFMLF